MSNILYKYNKFYSKVTPNGLGESRCLDLIICFIVSEINIIYAAVGHSAITLWPGVI